MKKYEIFDAEEKLHEYTITAEEKEKGTEYKMFRSEGRHWSHPGELILSCIDNGNLDLAFHEEIKWKKMDISSVVELRVFLNTISQYDKHIGNYKMVEVTNAIEV